MAALATAGVLVGAGTHAYVLQRTPATVADAGPTGRTPERIMLTWQDDPATTQAVTWRTAADGPALVQIARADASPRFRFTAADVAAVTSIVRADGPGVVYYHTALLRDLIPNTAYAYRVGDGTTWSEWFHFRTAGGRDDPFAFVYLGDAQNEIRSLWSRTLRAAFMHEPTARFFLHAGDLVNRPNNDLQWSEWFAGAGWIFGMVPSIPVAGNHEHTEVDHDNRVIRKLAGSHLSRFWNPQFALPANGPAGLDGTTYYVDVHDARIVVLNSSQRRRYREQARWLDDVLAASPQRWSIVAFHHPVHPSEESRRNPGIAREWQPVLERHGVDLVLQGHDHSYMRLAAPAGGPDDRVGPVYVVSVAGPKLYERDHDLPADRARDDVQLFQIVHVDRDRIRFEARLVTGELFDGFDLIRQYDGSNRLVEHTPCCAVPLLVGEELEVGDALQSP